MKFPVTSEEPFADRWPGDLAIPSPPGEMMECGEMVPAVYCAKCGHFRSVHDPEKKHHCLACYVNYGPHAWQNKHAFIELTRRAERDP